MGLVEIRPLGLAKLGHGPSAVGYYDQFAGLYPPQVVAKVVLEISNSHGNHPLI